MASKLTNQPRVVQERINSYLPTRHLLRFAVTCKSARCVVYENDSDWRARAVALRLVCSNAWGADPALRQIQNAMRLEVRVWNGYVAGVNNGPAVFEKVLIVCRCLSLFSIVFGAIADGLLWHFRKIAPLEVKLGDLKNEREPLATECSRIFVDNAKRSNEYRELMREFTGKLAQYHQRNLEYQWEIDKVFEKMIEKQDDFRCAAGNRTAFSIEAYQQGEVYLGMLRSRPTYAYPTLPPYPQESYCPHGLRVGQIERRERLINMQLELLELDKPSTPPTPATMLEFCTTYALGRMYANDRRLGPEPRFFYLAYGVLSLTLGILYLSDELPVQGSSLVATGSIFLVRGLTSRRFVWRVCGEVQGRWNVIRIRTSAQAKRLLHSPLCERVSSKFAAIKQSVSTRVSGVIASILNRALHVLPFADCG